jgi:hypothetical protein
MPQLELESSAKFLAIKRGQRTTIGKDIKLAQSSIKKTSHICDHRGKSVKTMSKSPWFEDLDIVLTFGWNGCYGCG